LKNSSTLFLEITLRTVNASNFGPHVNFGPFFPERLAITRRVQQTNEENESCSKTSDLQTCFWSFLIHSPPKEATNLPRNGQVRGFYGSNSTDAMLVACVLFWAFAL
jgi:hypothetical protein